MPSFLINTCATETVNFFHSGHYAVGSFSSSWFTRRSPDNEGLNTPVWQLVLDKFGIPASFPNGVPPGGTLPGIDIKRMKAIDAIRLSLAEALLFGEWWDVYEDGEGGVFFQRVFDGSGPGKFINLNVRLCIPSASKTNEVDIVVVRGYKYPPIREAREFRDVIPTGLGTINPTSVTDQEKLFTVDPSAFVPSCLARISESVVYKSYKDPILSDEFNPQEPNPFYRVKAFEKLIAYITRITGMPTNPDDTTRVQFEIRKTTPWYKQVDFPSFVAKSVPSCAQDLPQGFGITYYEGSLTYTSPDRIDRYGTRWPLVISPTGVYIVANKLNELIAVGGTFQSTTAFVSPIPEFIGLDAGSNWVWSVAGRGEYDITLYYQPNFGGTTLGGVSDWDIVLSALSSSKVSIAYSDGNFFSTDKAGSYAGGSFLGGSGGIFGGKGDLGYLVSKLFLSLELDRPCLVVKDVDGDALGWAEQFRMQYAPLVLIDEPGAIAYWKDGGGAIIDQSDGLEDSDPTTCQNFEETELERLQDMMQGNVVDVSLPFCKDGDEALTIAHTIFDYMSHSDVQTYNLTCAPSDEPELGAGVNGFPSNLVIESITYSYNDSSSYTIEVTLGPIFSNIGSWNAGGWARRREDVSRPGIIRWVAGDGTNYRVEVQGLGTFNAINSVETVFYPGETVQVTIYNVPVEE